MVWLDRMSGRYYTNRAFCIRNDNSCTRWDETAWINNSSNLSDFFLSRTGFSLRPIRLWNIWYYEDLKHFRERNKNVSGCFIRLLRNKIVEAPRLCSFFSRPCSREIHVLTSLAFLGRFECVEHPCFRSFGLTSGCVGPIVRWRPEVQLCRAWL